MQLFMLAVKKKHPDTPSTAFKTLTSEKSEAICYSARVGIAYEEQGESHGASLLSASHTEREYTTGLIF